MEYYTGKESSLTQYLPKFAAEAKEVCGTTVSTTLPAIWITA